MNYRSKCSTICIISILAIAACKPIVEQTALEKSTPTPPAATKDDWLKAVKATYKEADTKSDRDGITTFTACFKYGQELAPNGKPKCQLFAFGKRDAFRHITFFTPMHSELSEYSSSKYLHSYITVLDCERPNIMLSTHFFGKNGWLFMEKVAVMADNDIALEHSFEQHNVKRDNNSWGVDERAGWIASSEDQKALKTIADSKVAIVRITGSKGYVIAEKRDVELMKTDFTHVLAIYAALDAAAMSALPTSCK